MVVRAAAIAALADERVAERYLRQRARKQSILPGDRATLKRLLSVLSEAGRIPPAALPLVTPRDRCNQAPSREERTREASSLT
jgi:hypothetical protein